MLSYLQASHCTPISINPNHIQFPEATSSPLKHNMPRLSTPMPAPNLGPHHLIIKLPFLLVIKKIQTLKNRTVSLHVAVTSFNSSDSLLRLPPNLALYPGGLESKSQTAPPCIPKYSPHISQRCRTSPCLKPTNSSLEPSQTCQHSDPPPLHPLLPHGMKSVQIRIHVRVTAHSQQIHLITFHLCSIAFLCFLATDLLMEWSSVLCSFL